MLVALGPGDRAVLEPMVRAYYAEDGLAFDEERQGAALRALLDGDPLCLAWLVRLGGAPIGYVVVTLGFSLESGGRDGFIDELFITPAARNRGLGGQVLALVEDEARAHGLKRLYLEVAHGNPALALYRRAGFVDHRRYLMSKGSESSIGARPDLGGEMPAIFLSHAADARANYYGEEALARLRELGEVRLNETGRPLTTAELIRQARGCAVIVSDRQTEGPAAVFEELPDLVAFVRCAVDIRNVDVGAASKAGVLVTRASPGFVDSVAELTVGMMVDLARGISDATMAYRAGGAPRTALGRQLRGSTLGIIGYGRIGTRLAELGLALGMRVLVSDPHVQMVEPELRQTDLGTLLVESDFVVCLAVATAETENLIGRDELRWMKHSAYLINVARGDLVDERALEEALRDGEIAGCAMDVGRAPDQMPSPHLARLPGVVATPHIGGLVPQAIAHQALETTRQVAEILAGQAPAGAVNPEHATRLAGLRR
ncbi:MAG TPA: GNAT family N-acetyltransferase [Geminicoccaceae bacterium]|nr:GNAT family N-acetyltransferase [Geminicoccaceae bacterium]